MREILKYTRPILTSAHEVTNGPCDDNEYKIKCIFVYLNQLNNNFRCHALKCTPNTILAYSVLKYISVLTNINEIQIYNQVRNLQSTLLKAEHSLLYIRTAYLQ